MVTTARLEIFPADLDATTVFYTRVLGFEVAYDGRSDDQPYMAFIRDMVKVGAALRDPTSARDARRPPTGVELVLEVDDLDIERLRVAEAQWPVAEAITLRPWGLTDFRLLDPDGYYWRITSRTFSRVVSGASEVTAQPITTVVVGPVDDEYLDRDRDHEREERECSTKPIPGQDPLSQHAQISRLISVQFTRTPPVRDVQDHPSTGWGECRAGRDETLSESALDFRP